MTKYRRLALLYVSPELVVNLAVGRTVRVLETAMPEGAQVRRVTYDADLDMFIVAVEHETFPHVPFGDTIPVLPATIYTADDGAEELPWPLPFDRNEGSHNIDGVGS